MVMEAEKAVGMGEAMEVATGEDLVAGKEVVMEDNGVAVDQPRAHRAHRWTGNYDIDQDRFHGD